MHAWLNHDDVMVLVVAYELDRRAVILDEWTAHAWREPMDELVVWLSKRHHWPAETTVSYLATMRMLLIEHARPDLPPPTH
jgi:hypothetical protein